jgi:hypothetical protein
MENEGKDQKMKYIAKLLGFTIMYSIIEKVLMNLNNEVFIQNWAIGIIGVIVFLTLYFIDSINFITFRIDPINKFFILFFLSWVIADLTDFFMFIQSIIVV